MEKINQQDNPTNSIRRQIFERRREEFFNRRVKNISSDMGIREILFLHMR